MADGMMTQSLRRGILYLTFFALLLAATAAMAIVIDYVFWRAYVGELRDTERPRAATFETIPNVPAETLNRLGRIFTDKKSSFVNFERRKPPGVIRIGAFGDSFTYGDEVDEKSDYPAQLQRILREAGLPNVEVLNFGTSWYGFGQTHIMWNEVGRYFDLDYILLGPVTLFPERDTRFNHTDGLSPYYQHSRYILDKQGLRLIDAPGQTFSERFDSYYGFIPDRRFLLYDRGDPAFLAALLPQGSYVGNPFYYDKRDVREEAADIHRRLLQDMDRTGTPVIAAFYPWVDKPATQGENLCLTQFKQLLKFPYRAQYDHNSSTGTARLARQYLAVLRGQAIDARIMHTVDLSKDVTLPSVKETLASFDGVYIRLDGADAGLFAPSYPSLSRAKSPSFLREDKVKSLVALKAPQDSVLDGIFLAFPADISATAPVSIVMQSSEGTKTAALGALRPLADGINLGQADLPGLEIRDTSFGDRRITVNASGLAGIIDKIPANAQLQVMVSDKIALEGSNAEAAGKFVLRAPDAQLLIIRSANGHDLSADRGVDKGNIDLVLQRGAETVSIPVARWWMEQRQLEPAAGCSIKPLSIPTPVTIAVTAAGDQFDGPPQMRVYLDDKPVGDAQVTAVHNTGEWQTFIFSAQSEGPPATLRLALVNDKFDAASLRDRNLYIRSVTVGPQTLRLEDGVNSEGSPVKTSDGSRAVFSGSLAFPLDLGDE